MTTADAVKALGAELGMYTFRARSEAELQGLVSRVLERVPGAVVYREVRTSSGRLDLLVTLDGHRIVIELKLRSSVAVVERQAQRYALMPTVDVVCVVTTSSRLAIQLQQSAIDGQLGGKPFYALALRTM